jgi:hypothetical protein
MNPCKTRRLPASVKPDNVSPSEPPPRSTFNYRRGIITLGICALLAARASAVTVNGSPVFEYTKGGGNYANNYISLQGSGIADCDNLAVTNLGVPEPSSRILAALGPAGLGLARWVKRKRTV